jgi:negative regulator of sigma E activity
MTDEAIRRALGDPANPGEHLSALLDGELPPEQTDFLLKRVRRDAELRGTLQRYRLVGDTLRGERVQARPDFMLRVSAAIAAEPALPAPNARPGRRSAAALRWLKPVAGLAVAASVASVAVVVMQRDPGTVAGGSSPALVAATTATRASVPAAAPAPLSPVPAPLIAAPSLTGEPASYVTPPAGRGVGVIPPAQLASYVVAHSEYSSPLGRRNVLTGLVADEVQPAPASPPRAPLDAPVPAPR